MLLAEGVNGLDSPLHLHFRLERIDGIGGHHLAGGIDDCHLDAGTNAGIQPHGGLHAGGGRHQQILEVAGKHANGLLFGLLAQPSQQLGLHLGEQLDLPGPAHHAGQPAIRRASLRLDAKVAGDHSFAGMGDARALDGQRQGQDPLVASPQHGQRPVRWGLGDGLLMFKVVFKLGALLLLSCQHSCLQLAVLPQVGSQLVEQGGIFGEAFHQDIAGAIQRGFGIGYLLLRIDKGGCFVFWRQLGMTEQPIGQRLQPCLDGDLPLGAAFWLVG